MNFYDYNLNKIILYIYVIMEIEMKPSLIVPNVGLKKLGVLIKNIVRYSVQNVW